MTRAALIALVVGAAAVARADAVTDAAAEMEKAQDNLDRGEFDAAIGRFNVARSLVPQSSGPYLGLGLAYQRSGRCAEAIPFLEEYLRRKANAKPEAGAALADCRARTASARLPGKVQITSDPLGAEVRIDDANGLVVGNTPYESTALTPGTHRLFLSLRGFRPGAGEVLVQPGTTTTLAVALSPEPRPAPPSPPPEAPRPAAPAPAPAAPPVAVATTGKLILDVEPEASVVVNGVQVVDHTRHHEAAFAGGIYNVLAERDGYRAVATTVNILPGETARRTLTLPPIKRSGWLGLAVPFTVIAAVSGAAAIITFYAADGKPAGSSEFEDNKTANLALQGVCYPSIALASLGYILYGALNRGRISDGPPLRVGLQPRPDGGLASLTFSLH
jgi:hypothetical protein